MELGKVISLLRANEVPPSQSKRIRSYFAQHYLRHSAVDVLEILTLLPEKLRDDLASNLNPPCDIRFDFHRFTTVLQLFCD